MSAKVLVVSAGPLLAAGLLRRDGLVRATWSDAAREASTEARKAHAALDTSAMARTQEARNASDKAKRTGLTEDHVAAQERHDLADGEHTKAAKAAREAGDHAAYTRHHDYAESHFASAMEHRNSGMVAKASDKTFTKLVQCRDTGSELVLAASALWELDKPVDWQWMPGGVHVITAHYDGAPVTMAVQCDETTAKAVQASFEDWMKRNSPQEPFACVEHREEEAAVRPRAFAWKETPAPGVYCTGLPTELGARNVNGRIHRSFSPTFACDAEWDKATCVKCSKPSSDACACGEGIAFPDGVRGSASNPCRITGVASSIGSLTNKPAFRKILPVRATDAGDAKSVHSKTHGGNPVTSSEPETVEMVLARLAGERTAVTATVPETAEQILERLSGAAGRTAA